MYIGRRCVRLKDVRVTVCVTGCSAFLGRQQPGESTTEQKGKCHPSIWFVKALDNYFPPHILSIAPTRLEINPNYSCMPSLTRRTNNTLRSCPSHHTITCCVKNCCTLLVQLLLKLGLTYGTIKDGLFSVQSSRGIISR
ncbi:unnamed protein product, partial [Ectocarpus sp. 12 AP-2014]